MNNNPYLISQEQCFSQAFLKVNSGFTEFEMIGMQMFSARLINLSFYQLFCINIFKYGS